MRRRQSNNPLNDGGIDVSPLIDMVFILLIFFMVTTTFVKDMKLELDRPSASSSELASTQAIRVYVDKGSNVHIDGREVRPWMVQSHIRDALRAAVKKEVLVVSDGEVHAEKLIDVVDDCRLAGAIDVAVATEKEVGR